MPGFFKSKYKKQQHVTAVLVAAGSGTRMHMAGSKQLAEICGRPVIAHTLEAFQAAELVDDIVLVARQSDILLLSDIARAFDITKVTDIVSGGATRCESVRRGLEAAAGEVVAIHDGARPCVLPEHIDAAVRCALEHGAAALGCRVADTLKAADENGVITGTVDRRGLWQVQTPQVFAKELIVRAYESGDAAAATDDCMLAEQAGIPVRLVEGAATNIKITVQADLALAEAILEGLK